MIENLIKKYEEILVDATDNIPTLEIIEDLYKLKKETKSIVKDSKKYLLSSNEITSKKILITIKLFKKDIIGD